MPEAPLTPSELALEQTGLEFLRAGKFRKARDTFKTLKKTQPAHALPLIIDSNLGLAREMMSKGMVSEANEVLAYLKTIAPPTYNLSLSENSQHDAWSAMVPLAIQRLALDIQPTAAIRAADEIILGAESPDHPSHPDAKAILTALELGYSSAVTEQTTPLLRSIPRSSPFSHWVFFFKGMTALESGDHARAIDCFRRVPECSLLQTSLPALITVCGAPAETQPSTRNVHALCAWAGEPTLADPILQADPHWRKNQRAKAFTLLTKKIPDLLCFGARDFKADLSRFLTTEYIRRDLEDYNFVEKLFDYAAVESHTVARAVVCQSFFATNFAQFNGCAHRHFGGSLERLDEISRVSPISPAMLSRIFTRLAESYIDAVKKDPYDYCSPPNAKKALEHAIKHDPDHLHAWLTQCDLLAMGKDTSAYHRFLDDLTKRFPTEKEVLIRNGDCCIERAVYTKATRNFEQAAKIDAVDPRITHGALRAQLGLAEQLYKKGKPSKANWELIESLATAENANSQFSLWRLRVHRLVLEIRYHEDEKELIERAAAILPLAPSAFLLRTACCIGLTKYKMQLRANVSEKLFPANSAPQTLADFLAVIDEVETTSATGTYNHARNYAHFFFREHDNLLVELVDKREHLITLLTKVYSCKIPDPLLISPVIQNWYSRDDDDPILRYLCVTYRFPWMPTTPQYSIHEVIAEFRETKDPDIEPLLFLLEKDRQRDYSYLGSNDRTNKLDLDYDPHENDDDEDDDDEDYDEEEEEFAEALAAMDKAAKGNKISKVMAALSKIIGDAADQPQTPASNKPKPPAKIPPKQAPPEDPNQLNFDL